MMVQEGSGQDAGDCFSPVAACPGRIPVKTHLCTQQHRKQAISERIHKGSINIECFRGRGGYWQQENRKPLTSG